MRRILIVAAVLVCLVHPAIAQDVIGDWQGGVDQGMNGIPVTSMSPSQSKVKFTVESVNGSYEGILNAAAITTSGTWSQGQAIPLVFTRAANGATVQPMHNPATPSTVHGSEQPMPVM